MIRCSAHSRRLIGRLSLPEGALGWNDRFSGVGNVNYDAKGTDGRVRAVRSGHESTKTEEPPGGAQVRVYDEALGEKGVAVEGVRHGLLLEPRGMIV